MLTRTPQDTDDLPNSETGEKRSPRQQRRQYRKALQAFLKSLILLPLIGSASPAFADSFVVDGNKALNTNNSFSKIYGQPRMAVWGFNPNDPDQQFTIVQNRIGGKQLVHRSTGKCINAYLPKNGSDVNIWGCSDSDPDQSFDINSVGNGYYQIQRRGTTLCLDNPVRSDGGKVYLWDCDRTNTNANQRWKNSSVIVNPPPITGGSYYRNFEGFIHFAIGQVGISRLDTASYRGQCVTLIARYLQEVYLTGNDRTKALYLDNGGGTAQAVANQFGSYFLPTTRDGLPKRGAVVSFPDLGHTAIVMQSRTLANGQRQMTIMDSNKNGLAPNTQVQEYFYWINIPDGRANGYGNNIYWTNPR